MGFGGPKHFRCLSPAADVILSKLKPVARSATADLLEQRKAERAVLSEEATHAATFKVMLNNIRAEEQAKLNHNEGVTGVCAR